LRNERPFVGVGKYWIPLAVLGIVAGGSLLVVLMAGEEDGWVKVPRDTYEYDLISGEETVIRGILESNDRVILAIPKEGDYRLVSDEGVDRIVEDGQRDQYDFLKKDWSHRIRSDQINLSPSYESEGESYYVIVSSGTDAWDSSGLLDEFVGKEVEMTGKWDTLTVVGHPQISVIQFHPREIREVQVAG
jgi:hypothetical protein